MEKHDIKDCPRFTNHCNHETEEFIGGGSYVASVDKRLQTVWIDVYVYAGTYGQEICIRYNNDPEGYCSAGFIPDFISSCSGGELPMYRHTYDILKAQGTLKYVPNKSN